MLDQRQRGGAGASRAGQVAPAGGALRDPLEGASLQDAVDALPPATLGSSQEVATAGASGPGQPLPFRDTLARAFGGASALDEVVAHTDPAAAEAADALGAEAYATGAHVAFAGAPDLHTAAHEAAHVVQARDGVHRKALGGGGDAFEQHAEAVADRVVAGESAADLLAGGPGSVRAPAGEVQGLGIGQMRDDLVANSRNRTSNAGYNALLDELQAMAQLEARSVTRDELIALRDRIAPARLMIPAAASHHGLTAQNGTRVARNDALDDLDDALQDKYNELQAKIDADVVTPAAQRVRGDGPKAGFEMEYNDVFVVNTANLTQYQKRMLNRGNGALDVNFWRGVQEASGLGKRSVIFTSAAGTWEGQTDTTTTCTNLELVTKPLTAGEWNEDGGDAAQDAEQLGAFAAALDVAPRGVPLLPKQLAPGVALNLAGARLYKGDMHAYAQTQMTAAVEQAPAQEAPEWWIAGLRTSALENLRSVVRGLTARGMGNQNNPKSAVFLKNHLNVLIKSPMRQLLGQPTEPPNDEAAEGFVGGLAEWLGVNLEDNAVGQLVNMSNQHNQGRPQFRLVGADFTFRQYFEGLLRGDDLVTEWARTAFGGVEDIGVGQIEDPTLPPNWAVEEHRELNGVGTRNYLEWGRQWAATGRVPGT